MILQPYKKANTSMPGKTFEEMEKIRKWVKAALAAGVDSPRAVRQFIAQHTREIETPSLPTIGSIMRDEGYEPAGFKWERKK